MKNRGGQSTSPSLSCPPNGYYPPNQAAYDSSTSAEEENTSPSLEGLVIGCQQMLLEEKSQQRAETHQYMAKRHQQLPDNLVQRHQQLSDPWGRRHHPATGGASSSAFEYHTNSQDHERQTSPSPEPLAIRGGCIRLFDASDNSAMGPAGPGDGLDDESDDLSSGELHALNYTKQSRLYCPHVVTLVDQYGGCKAGTTPCRGMCPNGGGHTICWHVSNGAANHKELCGECGNVIVCELYRSYDFIPLLIWVCAHCVQARTLTLLRLKCYCTMCSHKVFAKWAIEQFGLPCGVQHSIMKYSWTIFIIGEPW